MECFGPEFGWHAGLNKKCTNNVIDGAKRTLGFTILRRSLGTRESKKDAMF